jgi:hypothetical protein
VDEVPEPLVELAGEAHLSPFPFPVTLRAYNRTC